MKLHAPLELFRAYAAVIFLDRAWIGVILMGATFIFPNVGFAGVLGAIVGLIVARAMAFAPSVRIPLIFNCLLVGLSLGAFFEFNGYLAGLIVLSASFAAFVTVGLADALWRWDRLPVLSLPFVLVAVLAALIAHNYTGAHRYNALFGAPPEWFGNGFDAFLNTLGAIFFTPHPLAGALVFAALLWRSRYLAALALGGYLAGLLVFGALTHAQHSGLLMWSGFNFALSAMALGGILTIPSFAGYLFALGCAAVAALLSASFMHIALIYQLPIMAGPFLVTTLTMLLALHKRAALMQPVVAPEPGLPEVNYERARLAITRTGEINSVPLLMPVYGEWCVYQGFDGEHTHRAPWQHALDLHMVERGSSFRGSGNALEDYYCFGVPVVSPVRGEVVRVHDGVPDNVPGEVDVANNWGNFVLLRVVGGMHVLLAHLRQHSVQVKEGQGIAPGTLIAQCGNSGRSPQPHLHMQVQLDAKLGSDTHPFHLCSVLLQRGTSAPEYCVIARPGEADRVQAVEASAALVSSMHLPVGRYFTYQLTFPGLAATTQKLSIELTPDGQFRIAAARGASAAFEEGNGVLAFYDRCGPRNRLLDLWLIALGVSPLTERAKAWRDAPSARLLPLTLLQRALLVVFHPLGCGVDSRYQREWQAQPRRWMQTGRHTLNVGIWSWHWTSTAGIDPEHGYVALELSNGKQTWCATLADTQLRGDEGIPGWKRAVNPAINNEETEREKPRSAASR